MIFPTTLAKNCLLTLYAIALAFSAGCSNYRYASPPELTSDVDGTTILHASNGKHQRCNDLYPDMYDRSVEVLSTMMSRIDAAGKPASYVTNPVARKILINSQSMLRNIMRHKYRPIHPAAFFAVVKDFETSTRKQWGINSIAFREGPCGAYKCSTLFQINLGPEPVWGNIDHGTQTICGDRGLGVLGIKGGPDFCAALFWWTMAGGGVKCANLREGKKEEKNPCTEPFTWTVNTFAFGHADTYIQHNQYGRYGIRDPWRRLYTGFRGFTDRYRSKHYHHYVDGYEHCAAEHFIKKHGIEQDWPEIMASTQDLYPLALHPKHKLHKDSVKYPRIRNYHLAMNELMTLSVKHYGYDINVTPVWSSPSWRPDLKPQRKSEPRR